MPSFASVFHVKDVAFSTCISKSTSKRLMACVQAQSDGHKTCPGDAHTCREIPGEIWELRGSCQFSRLPALLTPARQGRQLPIHARTRVFLSCCAWTEAVKPACSRSNRENTKQDFQVRLAGVHGSVGKFIFLSFKIQNAVPHYILKAYPADE